MIEAVMLWNEPNNLSHWDFELDAGWKIFADMVKAAARAVRSEHGDVGRVLGGISPIDVNFVDNMKRQGVLAEVDAMGVHGFPLDWNHWQIDEWPARYAEVTAAAGIPVWISEVGVSSFGAEEVQAFGLKRTHQLLAGLSPRIHWYSLFDLPRAWPATTRHREAEGSSYYRHFYMGLIREDGRPKQALDVFAGCAADLGICQWFHFEDPRLTAAVQWLKDLGVRKLRTGLSWADFERPDALRWFDQQMRALEDFDVTLTFCFTPGSRGLRDHHTSPPVNIEPYAEFCAAMVRRYAHG